MGNSVIFEIAKPASCAAVAGMRCYYVPACSFLIYYVLAVLVPRLTLFVLNIRVIAEAVSVLLQQGTVAVP